MLSSDRSVPVINAMTVARYRKCLQWWASLVFRHDLQLNREVFLFALRSHQKRRVAAWRALIFAQLDFDRLFEALVELPQAVRVYQLVGVDFVLAGYAQRAALVVRARVVVHQVSEARFDHDGRCHALKTSIPIKAPNRELVELTASPKTTQNIISGWFVIAFVLIIPTTNEMLSVLNESPNWESRFEYSSCRRLKFLIMDS